MRMYVCPRPLEWARVHQELLRRRAQFGDASAGPPKPLILNGWVVSSAREKHERWAETVEWAKAHGCEDVVASMPPHGFEHWFVDVAPCSLALNDKTSDE